MIAWICFCADFVFNSSSESLKGEGEHQPCRKRQKNTTYMDAHLDSAQILWGSGKGKIRNIVEPYPHVIQ